MCDAAADATPGTKPPLLLLPLRVPPLFPLMDDDDDDEYNLPAILLSS